jgi:putative oxidoreductase
MLAGIFVVSGVDVLRHPEPRVAKAEPVATQLADKLGLPRDPALLVRINAATHVMAGSLLAIGKFRRLSALALLASMVPTTYAGHRFWELDDPKQRSEQTVHFLKNLAIAGGLLLEAVDTEGRPSLGWWSRRAVRRAVQAAAAGGAVAKGASKAAKGTSKAAKGAAVLESADAARHAAASLASRELAQTALKVKAAKEVAGKTLDSAAAKNLVEKAAKAKAVAAVADLVSH